MKRNLAVLLCALLAAPAASAHRIDEYLQATLLTLTATEVQASMRLIPGVLVADAVIAAIDTDHDGHFSEAEEQAYAQHVLADLTISVDRAPTQPKLVRWTFPQPAELREGLGEIHLDYSIPLAPARTDRTVTLENRHLPPRSVYLVNVVQPEDTHTEVLAQNRNPTQSRYELTFRQGNPTPSTRGTWLQRVQFTPLFRLGMRHIAEGADHLLFLFTLLLPAPLLTVRHRWAARASTRQSLLHIVGIATAFTLGHSVTLTLAAFGTIRIPERPVEVLIAVSILVSALHALRPLFPGRESLIAASFGLIHGLAFAATLTRLGLSRWDRLPGILAFNLGIEAMQMLLVAAILPLLLLLSRTRAYPALRIAGASLAATASLVWIAVRLT